MALQFSSTLRNAVANAVPQALGPSPVLVLRSGSPPASPSSSDIGTLLWTKTLSTNWATTASTFVPPTTQSATASVVIDVWSAQSLPALTQSAAATSTGPIEVWCASVLPCFKQKVRIKRGPSIRDRRKYKPPIAA